MKRGRPKTTGFNAQQNIKLTTTDKFVIRQAYSIYIQVNGAFDTNTGYKRNLNQFCREILLDGAKRYLEGDTDAKADTPSIGIG